MRYDTTVIFKAIGPEVYNPQTGAMTTADQKIGQKMCALYDLSSKEKSTLLGRIDVRAMVIHHKGQLIEANAVEIDGARYWVRSKRWISYRASYVLEESQDESQH